MNENLAYVENEALIDEALVDIAEQAESAQSLEIQNAEEAVFVRIVDVIWIKRGQTHAFHKNGSMNVSLCGQEIFEVAKDVNQSAAREANCIRCEKFVRKLSRMSPTSQRLKEILSIHSQAPESEYESVSSIKEEIHS